MKRIVLLALCLATAACASTDNAEEPRKETAVQDYIAVNELDSVSSMRTDGTLSYYEINDTYLLVSTNREDFLLEYFTGCMRYTEGRVEPDFRRDPRRIYAGADTFRGCRIKELYSLDPAQADELREIGRSVGGGR
jgi:hypothetical protein